FLVGRQRDDDRIESVGAPARFGLRHVLDGRCDDAEPTRPAEGAQHAQQHLMRQHEETRGFERRKRARAEQRRHRHAGPLELSDRRLDAANNVSLGDEGGRPVSQASDEDVVSGPGREGDDLGAAEAVEGAALSHRHGGPENRLHVGHDVDARRLADGHEPDDRSAHRTCSQGRVVSAPGFQKPVPVNQVTAWSASAVFTMARVAPSSKKPPNASRPAPRISISANWAMSSWDVGPSTIVALREPSRTTGTISQGSTNWLKLL